jgi:SecD/SecF fusion protein
LELDADEWLRSKASDPTDSLLNVVLAKMHRTQGQDAPIALFQETVQELGADQMLHRLFYQHATIQSTSHEIIASLQNQYEGDVQQMVTILRARCQPPTFRHPEFLIIAMQRIMLIVEQQPDSQSNSRDFLRMTGQLGFFETYTYDQIVDALYKIEAKEKAQDSSFHLFDHFLLPTGLTKDEIPAGSIPDSYRYGDEIGNESGEEDSTMADTVVPESPHNARPAFANQLFDETYAYVHASDTARVGRALSSDYARQVLPGNLRFAFGWHPIEANHFGESAPDYFEVVALKTVGYNKPLLDGSVITDAHDSYTVDDRLCVSITMNAEGAAKWEAITRDNLGRAIAITFDGMLLTAPKVMGAIAGGRSEITGNFTLEEAQRMASILKAGAYPSKVNILGITLLEPAAK